MKTTSVRDAPLDLLDPQIVKAQQRQAEIVSALGPPGDGITALRDHSMRARAWWNEGGPEIGEVVDLTVPGPFRETPIRLYRPKAEGTHPVFVYLHGGGYRLGAPQSNDRQMRELVDRWGGAVISADYVHMPEHVFPDAVEETASLLTWLADNAQRWSIDGGRIAFGGSSAGANVALGAVIHLGGVKSSFLKAGAMICAVFDHDPESGSMYRFGGEGFYPTRASAIEIHEAYLPDPVDRDDPRAQPLRADPAMLPPLFIAAAEADVFVDGARRMSARLDAAGRDHAFKVYPGMTHLFFGMSRMVDRASECVSDISAFLTAKV
ncbi:MAG TPA: alpha/beta hydrolase fold domain-containing protein [Alphaproteobacteria bacterium]|nr:alpha/beta hydrolase fold domain-containing protein [Alphaproteobacteria bacterium]